ncbi:hypothetical protein PFISCL1PPCAC_22255, partial [Pristionchus fissidentatus]
RLTPHSVYAVLNFQLLGIKGVEIAHSITLPLPSLHLFSPLRISNSTMCMNNRPHSLIRRSVVDTCDCSKLRPLINLDAHIVTTSDPFRPTLRRAVISDNKNASTFTSLNLTAAGSKIHLNITHNDGSSAIFVLESDDVDDVIIRWNERVLIDLVGLQSPTKVEHYGRVHSISVE